MSGLPDGVRAVTLYKLACSADDECDWWDEGDLDGAPAWSDPHAARKAAGEWGFRPDGKGGLYCRAHADEHGIPAVDPIPGQLPIPTGDPA